jgi:hypothetical protein
LGAFDIVVSGLQQFENDVLDVLADITRFVQRSRIGHGEGNVEDARQRLGEQSLTGAGRAPATPLSLDIGQNAAELRSRSSYPEAQAAEKAAHREFYRSKPHNRD